MEMIGGSSAPYLLVPLAFPCFVLRLIGVETAGLLDYQGRAGDHFHCAVEPSPGHIRCRLEAGSKRETETKTKTMVLALFSVE